MSKGIKTSVELLAAFALATLAFFIASPASSQSHFMQPIGEHVMLQFFSSGGGVCPIAGGGTLLMVRVFPDGNTTGFAVPKGKVLVVTDFNARGYLPSNGALARSSMTATLRLKKPRHGGPWIPAMLYITQ